MSPITTLVRRDVVSTNSTLKLWEVGPRDGLQSEKQTLPLEKKRHMVAALMDAGVRQIEVGSFVKAVPQLRDTDELVKQLADHPLRYQTKFTGLVFNERGLERALESGVDGVCLVVFPSETMAIKNSGVGSYEGLRRALDLASSAKKENLFVRVDIGTAWTCPYEGLISAEKVFEFSSALLSVPYTDEVALADTLGHAHPTEVMKRFLPLTQRYGTERLAAHFHDTQGFALANVTAAYSIGVSVFDASVGGLGGCPFAPGAAGNLATEDLLLFAQKMQDSQLNSVDLSRVWKLIDDLEACVDRPLGGRSRGWWRGRQESIRL
jgi:hydroxymethylglutaryl-CoA lyase